MSNPESIIQADIALAVGALPGVRLFRNSVGVGFVGHVERQVGTTVLLTGATRVTFGLCPGSSDLIGWRSVVVTPDMVGQRVAIFAAPEVKTVSGRAEGLQRNWLDVVRGAGGIAGIVRSPDDARKLLRC